MQVDDPSMVQRNPRPRWSTPLLLAGLAAAVLLSATAFSVAYVVRTQQSVRELTAARDQLTTELNQTRGRLAAVEQKLENPPQPPAELPSPAPEPAPAKVRPSPFPARTPSHATRARRQTPAEDPRWAKMQSQLAEQQKQIDGTRQDIDRNSAELRGQLDTARNELNDSIGRTNSEVARNHDELVQLQRRGESNYYEFKLSQSKQFQRVGPLAVAVRKVNDKHQYFDMSMMVDDFKLDKKHVNLYEPVWINLGDRPRPVELVVNRIGKKEVEGYIREPKYKNSDLAASSSQPQSQPALQTR